MSAPILKDGVLLREDSNGRLVDSEGNYGYRTHFAGMYVCYTDGHLCECWE
jgi:hypothetical protein